MDAVGADARLEPILDEVDATYTRGIQIIPGPEWLLLPSASSIVSSEAKLYHSVQGSG